MSEQYRCKNCGYVFDMKDMMCSECGIGYFERLRWTKGGDGSHWEGCADVHWDCKIAQLEAELARRDEIIARLKEDGERMAEEHTDFDGYVDTCRYCGNKNTHEDDCAYVLHRALMKELE